MKQFFDKFWYDMVFARSVVLALLMFAGAYYAQNTGRTVIERLVIAAVPALATAGAGLSSSSGVRPNGGNVKCDT